MKYQRQLLASSAVALALSSPALAADPSWWKAPSAPAFTRRPAVDGVNGKLEGFGGWADWRGWGRRGNVSADALGSITAPIGDSFGVQIDSLAASHRGFFVGGGGGHLFWRDPGVGLVGAYGTVIRNNRLNDTRYRIGGEGAAYYGPFTLSGVAGYEEGSANYFTPLGFGPGFLAYQYSPPRGRFFDMVDISVYPTYNIKLSVGHRYVGGLHAAALGGEALVWNMGSAAVTGFIEGRVGENDYKAVWGGLRIYLGQQDKPLIARHREDDPPNWLKDDMVASQNAVRQGALYLPPTAPTPPSETCPCGPCYPN